MEVIYSRIPLTSVHIDDNTEENATMKSHNQTIDIFPFV